MKEIVSFNLPVCPHCGMKVSYGESFVVKNKSLFNCPQCRHDSKVNLRMELFQILGFVEAISLIVFAFVVFKGGGSCLIGVGIITLIFGIFYWISPFFVRLQVVNNKHNNKNSGNTNPKQVKEIESNKSENMNTENEIFSN